MRRSPAAIAGFDSKMARIAGVNLGGSGKPSKSGIALM
jgi:hypothetical protein